MPKNSKPQSAESANLQNNEIESEFKSDTATHHEIAHDWQMQLATKNAAILKSIEDLIDASLKNSSEN